MQVSLWVIHRTCIYANIITLQMEENPYVYYINGLEFSLLCTQEYNRSYMLLRILSCIYWSWWQQRVVTALELALSWFCLQVPEKSWVCKREYIHVLHKSLSVGIIRPWFLLKWNKFDFQPFYSTDLRLKCRELWEIHHIWNWISN